MICLARSSSSFALGLADLERRGVGKVAEVVKMVVEPLQLGQQRAQPSRPRRHGAARGRLNRLAVGERVGDSCRRPRRARRAPTPRTRQALEAFLHAAVLEEQLRLEVEDVFADVEENELRRLDDVGAHRPEGQQLHVAACDLGQPRSLPALNGIGAPAG